MMKKLIPMSALILCSLLSNAQVVDIPDEGFKQYLLDSDVDTNGDGDIQVSEALQVTEINLPSVGVPSEVFSIEGIQAFTNLVHFSSAAPFLEEIPLQGLTELKTCELSLDVASISLGLQNCVALESCTFKGEFGGSIDRADFTGCVSLTNIEIANPAETIVTEVILDGCVSLEEFRFPEAFGLFKISTLGCTSLRVFELGAAGSLEDFSFVDLESLDSLILTGNIGNVLISNNPQLSYVELRNITGVEFTGQIAVEHLIIEAEAPIPSLILENNSKLERVQMLANVLGTISFAGCDNLRSIDSWSIIHQTLNLAGCKNLINAPIAGTELLVDMTDCQSIEMVRFEGSQFETDVTVLCSGMTSLRDLSLISTSIGRLSVDGCYNLWRVDVMDATAPELDFSTCINLSSLTIMTPNFEPQTINLKNGVFEDLSLWTIDNPFIEICVDEDELSVYEAAFTFPNVVFTTSCTTGNESLPYILAGSATLDVNGDSCQTSTQEIPFAKFSLGSDEGWETSVYANQSGSLLRYLPEGEYTLTPQVPYGMELFTLYPSQATLTLPDSIGGNPSADFCYIATQDLDIVDVTLIPIGEARPGFDAEYRITYTNTGNIIKDGDIVLEFPDDVLDFVSATPDITTIEEGLLSWSFEGLVPFETRSIDFTMNLNSPMETPPLNNGDVLSFTARVSPIGNVTITSYWSYLNQTVVNSFDPNDKTCLDGDELDIEDVGGSVKYMIRFENIGSADAINVVVIDTIDTNSFDIKTIEVLTASHDVRTEIDGNEVKFIFDDIYLPFDDANNDGYVTFRINTLDDLTLGHKLENRAGIYFDFNFPIITNTTSTEVSETTSTYFEKTSVANVTCYPNPANNVVNISAAAEIDKVVLKTASGLTVGSYDLVSKNQSTYRLSLDGYASGLYLLEVHIGEEHQVRKLVIH